MQQLDTQRQPIIKQSAKGSARNRFTPKEKPKNAKKAMIRFLKMFAEWKYTFFLATILSIFVAVIGIAIPYYLGTAIDTFHPKTHTLDTLTLYRNLKKLFFLYTLNLLLQWAIGFLLLFLSQQLVYTLRHKLFAKFQMLSLRFFDRSSQGDLMSRMSNDTDMISTTLAQTITSLISSVITLVGAVVVMLHLNLYLTAVVFIGIPFVGILTKLITKKSRAYYLGQQRSLGKINGILQENILGLSLVKAFQKEDTAQIRFQKENSMLKENSIKAQIWSGYMMPFMNVLNNLTFALLAIVGGYLCVKSNLKVGVVVSFLSYSKQFQRPLNGIAGMFSNIQSALAGAERIFEVLDAQEEKKDEASAIDLKNPQGKVMFEKVSFSYEKDKKVLNEISFCVEPGKTVALVGPTGAGKTTIVNLMNRFYDAQEGKIYIDDIDITKIKRESLMQCFSVVLQDTCIFDGTIFENIRYAKPKAKKEEVIWAAKFANADAFIQRLEKGYDTLLHATDEILSTGEKQLLAIARAVLSDAPILILDEATSSVDTKTEKEIQKAMTKLKAHRTSFLIAHRLSTIRDADEIMVIGEGKILEKGTHDILMQKQGYYFQMVSAQTK